jgi:glucosyl-dolichyl phosphate glucuronosyltransferase
MKVSVVICTWNRDRLLEQTLSRFHALVIPSDVQWELLVVNNNCTDNTDGVIRRHAGALPLKPLHEAKPGKSNALNRAASQATGDLVLYTDDDVLVDPDWLTQYVRVANDHPEAGFFGGTVRPWFASPPPRWIERHLAGLRWVFALADPGTGVRPIDPEEKLLGANMAVRGDLVRSFEYDPRLGPNGDDQTRGEETEMIERFRGLGQRGLWAGDAVVDHYIPSERLCASFIKKWHFGYGRVLVRQQPASVPSIPMLLGRPRWILRRLLGARLRRWVFSPFRNERWLDAFKEEAILRGMLFEYAAAGRPG